ncbi:MAG: hypothetical protein Q9171_007608 [Xanthocarpia ochracea]
MAQTDDTFVLFWSYLVRKYGQLRSEVKIIALTAILLAESLDNCYIHLGNVLFCLPESEHSSSQRAIEEFGTPQRGEVSRKDGASLEKGLPEYLVEPFEYKAKNSKFLGDIQLIDFSEYSSTEGFLPLEQQIRESYFKCYKSSTFELGDGELELLGRYLRKMLIVDPKKRAKSGDLLAEAWISESV